MCLEVESETCVEAIGAVQEWIVGTELSYEPSG